MINTGICTQELLHNIFRTECNIPKSFVTLCLIPTDGDKQQLLHKTFNKVSIFTTDRGLLTFHTAFLADRTIGRAYGTVRRLSSVCRLSVCNVLYCGKMVRPSQKVSEGVNRKPGSKSSFFRSPPYFYFRFRHYGH